MSIRDNFENVNLYSSIEKEEYIYELEQLAYFIGRISRIGDNCRCIMENKNLKLAETDKKMLQKIMHNADKVTEILLHAEKIMNEEGIIIPKYF